MVGHSEVTLGPSRAEFDSCCEILWLLKNSLFLKKAEIWVIENV